MSKINYIFLDLEMNDVLDKSIELRNEIIQFGAIKYDNKFNELERFNKLIKPKHNGIVDKITLLTGITNKDVENAIDFKEGMSQFLDFCGDDYKIIVWSENDYRQFKKECDYKNFEDERLKYMYKHWLDFQRQFCKMIGLNKEHRISLTLALSLANCEFKGKQHDALFDAKNTAYLYKISRNKENFKMKYDNINEILFPKEEKVTIGSLLGEDMLNSIREAVNDKTKKEN